MSGETKQVKRGRGHSYLLDGEKAIGVTKAIGSGVPKPALIAWGPRVLAEFVAERLDEKDGHILADQLVADLGELARADGKTWPEKFSRLKIAEVLKVLHYMDRDAAGNRGTEVHRLAELLAKGEEVTVPEELVGHVDSYIRFLDEWDPEPKLLEAVVGNRKWNYMGALDSVMEINGLPTLDGADRPALVQIDLKTNRSGPFGEVGLQLAGYERAEFYLDDEGDERPCWEIDGEVRKLSGSYVLWLRADGYDLKPVETSDRVFRLFLYAKEVAGFIDEWGRDVVGETLTPPAREAGTA